MIITKEIEIIADWANIKRYEELGYGEMKQGDKFIIKVEHLKSNSLKKVEIECDFCGAIIKRRYGSYLDNIERDGKFCCGKCKKYRYKETCLEKYGVDNTSKLPETHNKIKETCLERYNDTNFRNTKKAKETKLEKYGDEVFVNRLKYKETCLERFGVENASQSPEIFSKQQKARYEIHQHIETGLYYQGSYEKDFLDNYYDKVKIIKMDSIPYKYKNKNKKYFPDFFLPEHNLIVEIKSIYTYDKYVKKNKSKQKSCINLGYKHIFIINKNYSELESIIYSF